MRTKVQIRKRLTSGNVKDPELHEKRIREIEQRRAFRQVLGWALAGAIAFVAAAFLISLQA